MNDQSLKPPSNQSPAIEDADRPAALAAPQNALRWALWLSLGVGAVVAVGLWVANHHTPSLTLPGSPAELIAEIPLARFTDITAQSGIRFVHNNGAYGDKLLPETMGGG